MLIFSRRDFGRPSDQAEQTKDGTYQVAAKLGPDCPNSQGDQPRPDLGLLCLEDLSFSVQLALDGDQCVKQGERA
jgi:hypothetical protein